MEIESRNTITIIGLILKYNNIYISILILFLLTILSCKSKNAICDYSTIYDSITNERVYEVVDRMPVFNAIGGSDNIGEYIIKRYDDSTKVGLQLSIKLRFVINKRGELVGAGIYGKNRNEYTDVEKQIVKIAESSPNWEPGLCSDHKVNVLVRVRMSVVIDKNGKLR